MLASFLCRWFPSQVELGWAVGVELGGGGGGFHSIMWSHQLRLELKLGCVNENLMFLLPSLNLKTCIKMLFVPHSWRQSGLIIGLETFVYNYTLTQGSNL